MDLSILGILRIIAGSIIVLYVGYCMINQKVWLRGPIGLKSKTFAWGSKEDNKSLFMIHVIIGGFFGAYLIVTPFLW